MVAIAALGSLFLLKHYSQWLTVSAVPQAQAEDTEATPSDMISYETLEHPRSIIHVVRIPAAALVTVTPIITPNGLKKIDALAKEQGAVAAINGGFFDPNNQQTTSFITRNGNVVLDPATNARLVNNPDLFPYMSRILNRSEFRRYQCQSDGGETIQYAIAFHQSPPPSHCRLVDALGAGPALLPQFSGEAEAFLDATTGRDAIGSQTSNARSAVGITAEGDILLIMAAQRADVKIPSGLTLTELAAVMTDLGVKQGLNLDGGSSSSLYYRGNTYYGRLDADKNAIKRPIKSALAILSVE